jgi:hypothetical protein
MTDLIVVPQTNQWHKLKALVLDSVSSPITRRVYNLGLDEFFAWFGQEEEMDPTIESIRRGDGGRVYHIVGATACRRYRRRSSQTPFPAVSWNRL